ASLRDPSDQRYPTEPYSSAFPGIRLEKPRSLYPGERIQGKLRFQIPEAVTDWSLAYASDMVSGRRVRVRLGSQPAVVKAPENIPGEFVPSIHKVGEALSDDILTITVNNVTVPTSLTPIPPVGSKYVIVDLTVENR